MASKKLIVKKTTVKQSVQRAEDLYKTPSLKQRIETALQSAQANAQLDLEEYASKRESLKAQIAELQAELRKIPKQEKEAKKKMEDAVFAAAAIMPLCGLKSAKSVAAFLKKNGIKGDRELSDKCPLAAYFKKQLQGKKIEVSVGSDIQIDGLDIDASGPLAEFVDAFDGGKFPELDKDPKSFNPDVV
jgi:hypothetical protein